MTRKDITILLAPIVMFLIVGVGLFGLADTIHQRVQYGNGHEKFEAFVQNVQSGRWQLTTDRWLEAMRRQQAVRSADLEVDVANREFVLSLSWGLVFGIIVQVAAVLHVRKRLLGDR